MSTLLNIITPCTQTEDLKLLHDSIVAAKGDLPIPIKWYVIYDSLILDGIPKMKSDELEIIIGYEGKEESVVGNAQVNWALGHIQEGYVHILKEDNLMHPDILKHYYSFLIKQPQPQGGMLVQQYLEDSHIRPILVLPSSIDCAQWIVNYDLLDDGDGLPISFTNADGIFIQKIYDKYQNKFLEIDKPLAYLKKTVEYHLVKNAPDTFDINSLVEVNQDYFSENIATSTNYMLFGTVFKLKRQFNKNLLITNIMEEGGVCLVVILPLRRANIAWRHGKGTVIKFESREQAEKTFKLIKLSDQPCTPLSIE